ncbi:MAG: N-methyl-L-tryptophan oxidase [Candidatus Saccharimonadales bacterium]
MQTYEAVIVGLGAMGSATAYQLAKEGVRVLGIDQFAPPHSRGSSHGETRITRQAIAEGKEYVPLVTRANEIWHEIEQETGRQLYTKTGILIMASNTADHPNKFLDSTIEAAKEYGIAHDELLATDIEKRFPQFKLQGGEKGYFEHGAGFLGAEECVAAQLELAEKYGAELHMSENLTSYKQQADGIIVTTSAGQYKTKKLVLSVGPWIQNVLPDSYKDKLRVYRQVLYWFKLDGTAEQFSVGNMPVFNWEFNTAHEDFIYGFPSLDGKTIKVATEQYLEATSPDSIDREVSAAEKEQMYQSYVAPHFRGVSAECVRAEVCMYTWAPDWRFLVDYLPGSKNIIVVSPCSGHGFKHSAAIGEAVAQMVASKPTTIDLSSFSFERLDK